LNNVIKHNPNIKSDFAEKNVSTVDFSKKLLGQIVFLYFLQKKGWFGVKRNEKWGSGSKRFLRDLFDKKIVAYKFFFNDVLEPLFYDALSRDRSDIDHWNDHFQCKIPFLNGGLFDPISGYSWEKTDINLPNNLFSNEIRDIKTGDIGNGILDIFDRYNFTVKEDEPLEKEVAVDPEMLGKVFENLLEVKDRKSKGTYYTPREIVHYMCEQSLVNYLANDLDGKVSKEDLDKLIKFGENVAEYEATYVAKRENNPNYAGKYGQAILPKSIEKFAEDIDESLADIKICDPAIGSGAFPVGMMNEIVKSRSVLSIYIKNPKRTIYGFKRDCIQNSLYGVDIDPGAIEIAKLRLWLSLVVDEDDIKQIKPLPNLDYKIMQGNSLLEEFENVKLFDEKLITAVDTGKEKQIELFKQKQSILQKEYFELHSENKLTSAKQAELNGGLKKLQMQLNKLSQTEGGETEKSGLFDIYSKAKKKAKELKRLHKEFFEETQKSKKDDIKKQIEQLGWELIEATLKEQNKMSQLKKIEEFKKSNTKPFFLWRLNFADVFEDKGGFDVIIANPPYINTNDLKKESEIYRKLYSTAYGSYDIYVLFFEKSIQLLKRNGILTFITSNKYFIADYAKKLRALLKTVTILNLIDLADCKRVFENAFVSPAITIIQNEKSNDYSIKISLLKDDDVSVIDSIPYSLMGVNEISNGIEGSFNIYIDLKTRRILNKISLNTVGLDDAKFFDVRTGIMGFEYWNMSPFISEGINGNSSIRVITNSHLDKYVFLFNKKINLYKKNFNNPFLNLAKAPINQSTKDCFRQTKIIIRGVASQLTAQIDEEGYAFLVAVHAVFIKDKNSFDEKYILALLNSTLFNWLHLVKFYTARIPMGSLKYPVSFLRELPIRKISIGGQASFSDLVDKILKNTKTDGYLKDAEKQAKVRDLERQIDELVYKLYGLTKGEIQIVESTK